MNASVNSSSNGSRSLSNLPHRTILGVRIDDVTLDEAIEMCDAWLLEPQQHFIVTPNPEMLVAAANDSSLQRTLNQSGLSVADGIGILITSRLLGQPIRHRIAGVDLADALLALAARRQARVFFLGASPGTATQAADCMRARHPGLEIVGAMDGGVIVDPTAKNAALIDVIASARPDIMIVAFGHGKQEQFIHTHLAALPSVRIAIGVGGAFDYWAGHARRAPRLWRRLGLEWMYRLRREPHRLTRIFRATVVFPYLALVSRRENYERS